MNVLDQNRQDIALKLGYMKRVYVPWHGYFLVEPTENDWIIHTTHEAGEREKPMRTALRNVPMWGMDVNGANIEFDTLLKTGYRLDECVHLQDDEVVCFLTHPDKASNLPIRRSDRTLSSVLRACVIEQFGSCRAGACEEPTIHLASQLLSTGAIIKAEYLDWKEMFYVDVWKRPSGRGCGNTFTLALFNAIHEHLTL